MKRESEWYHPEVMAISQGWLMAISDTPFNIFFENRRSIEKTWGDSVNYKLLD